ncbi:uncharacterized protein LOC123546176 [Mercenaria mercenaria]|uniref:uncharacterized protein LOC123546176 n=1 Tax=Mercenaria mercenaria TaxID=6596 RepID=UPI00234FA07D|nr:uncharacterized protein LOC123546176 [Mercenaria mercenaria]
MIKPIQLLFQVKLNAVSASQDLPLVVYKIVENMASFTAITTGNGRYRLEIYTRDRGTQDTEDLRFRQVAQYLVECNDVTPNIALSTLPPGYVRPQPKITEFGLQTLNEHDPLVELKSWDHIEIQLATTRDPAYPGRHGSRKVSDFIYIQTQPSIATFLVSIPSSGFYKLPIHGNVAEDQSHTSLGLFNYLFHCKEVT